MKVFTTTLKCLAATMLLGALAAPLRAWEPNARELDAAISSGDFAGYLEGATTWLNKKVPATPDEAALGTLLKDPVFITTLDQRHLISRCGADKLGAFAKADPANKTFLSWLLKNTQAMHLYLEGAVPLSLVAREADKYVLDTAALEIWKNIVNADPDAKQGIHLKLAIATAIAPPGSSKTGAGGAATPACPVVRYKYYKTAHKNGELFPSFDDLSVWEYTRIVSTGASDEDLTWAREMLNTFRPDLRVDERVVEITSLVWRRAAPPQFYPDGGYQNFKNVLAGGGKCGPRSSWAVMICQAFGIPAIGVGQPGHACVAFKAANPLIEPQPGSAWKVGYGGGWDKSTLLGMKGPEFLQAVNKRSDAGKFSQVEHLRWLASALATPDKASAVMGLARQIDDSITAPETDLTASLKAEEAEADPGAVEKSRFGKSEAVKGTATTSIAKPEAPIAVATGVIHVEAASFVKTGGRISWGGQVPNVLVHDSHTGGRQIYFQQQMKEQWADYNLDVPAAGTYEVTMKAASINDNQALEVCSGTNVPANIEIPFNFGLWDITKPVELELEKGSQTLRVQTSTTEHKRGIALKWFELKKKD